jgi:hypothetical protein
MQQWKQYPEQKFARPHALLHEMYISILRNGGGNQFNLLHSHINQRQAHGQGPVDTIVY